MPGGANAVAGSPDPALRLVSDRPSPLREHPVRECSPENVEDLLLDAVAEDLVLEDAESLGGDVRIAEQ